MTAPETHKLWGGRFTSATAAALDAVNRSLAVDHRLWSYDVRVSRAWTLALNDAGVLTDEEASVIRAGLEKVAAQLAATDFSSLHDEDIHTVVDRMLHECVGEPASKLHTGRSRNDQVATDTRLWCMDAARSVVTEITHLQVALLTHADALTDVLMPAYTHLQRAQPISASHWLLAHFWSLDRDVRRLESARDSAATLPLGSGAIAGSAFPVSRELLRKELEFARISENSVDAVGDRDFAAEFLFAATLAATHLSRLAEDLILFGTSEFGFVRFGDRFSTGSSMMPQKRNPDALELARGSAARTLGSLVTLIATLKGIPSGYNKDLQDDKRALFETADAVTMILAAVTGAVSELTFDSARMASALSDALMATDLADYLVTKGVSFREAHAAVGSLIKECETTSTELSVLPFSSFQRAHPQFADDARSWLSAERSVQRRDIQGGTGPDSIKAQIVAAQKILNLRRR